MLHTASATMLAGMASMRAISRSGIGPVGLAMLAVLMTFWGISTASQSVDDIVTTVTDLTAYDMRQVVNCYCVACHNDTLATADFSLQSIVLLIRAITLRPWRRSLKKYGRT